MTTFLRVELESADGGGGPSGRIEITSCSTCSHTGSGPASILANDLLRPPQTSLAPAPSSPVSLVFRGGSGPVCVWVEQVSAAAAQTAIAR